jgi:hypothetical protein
MEMSQHDAILKRLEDKSVLKQDVFATTFESFRKLKESLKSCTDRLTSDFENKDKRVTFHFTDRGDFQAEIKVAGDVLIFMMHTNVFQFDSSHPLWKSAYLKDNPANSYVGVINIYNFLSDSFKYNRSADIGYMIGRVFINREGHFMVQGKRSLGYKFNDFVNNTLTQDVIREIIESAITYCLDFDLLIPPYENMQELSVEEIRSISESHTFATGKRLGFKFGIDDQH